MTQLSTTSEQIPLELIISAASRYKKLTERIIGFVDFDWYYTIDEFEGTCLQPVDFDLFDEILCDLLLIDEMPAKEIGSILGLNIVDPAEKGILLSAIDRLKKDKMIDGDESVYWLTDVGKEYAKNGVKISTVAKIPFSLYIDEIGGVKEKAKEIFSNLTKEKKYSNQPRNVNVEDIKPLAEVQAPEVHFPKKNYLLQDCKLIGEEMYVAKVWIVLLENFSDDSVRAIVYDKKQDKIIEPLSDAFDKLEEKKINLLEKLIKVNEDYGFSVESTSEEKSEKQLAIEKELIQKQDEFEIAIKMQDTEKIKEIEKQVLKRHFNSLEFEIELKRLFDETSNDLWIISPWIKKATLRRIPFFEKYLQKGGRIFIGYSNPEDSTSAMADKEVLNKLLELEKKYPNFYLNQMDAFHYKMVWLRNSGSNDLYYTGSYNILSFSVKQDLQNVRQEEMVKLNWDDEAEILYSDIFNQFSMKYLNLAIDAFNALTINVPINIDKSFLKAVKKFNCPKLKPFENNKNDLFSEKYQQFKKNKENKLKMYREQYVQSEARNYKHEASELSKQTIPSEKKKNIQGKLNALLNEFPEFNESAELKEVSQLISNLKVIDSGKNNPNKHNKNKKNRK